MAVDRDELARLLEDNRLWIQRVHEEVQARASAPRRAARGFESSAIGAAGGTVEMDRSLESLEALRQVIRARLETTPER